MKTIDLKLMILQDQYDKLTETVSRASALTQIIVTMSADNFQFVPINALYNFLTILDDLTYQTSQLRRAIKPQCRVGNEPTPQDKNMINMKMPERATGNIEDNP